MRGSDPDASVYYLAAMLEGGEDPRFIARRMIVLASEDIGLADPQALVVAVAAAQAVEHVGLPEARLNLAEAAIYLALAPKSNAVITALGEAAKDVRELGHTRPPDELRDTHYYGAKKLGRGEGYIYPHSDPRGFEVDHLPEPLKGKKYYRPSESSEEEGERWRLRRPRARSGKAICMSGSGRVSTGSGVLSEEGVTWSARAEDAEGVSPEELIAAAHATCVSMALSHALAEHGHAPTRLETEATATFDKTAAGFRLTTIKLAIDGEVEGIDGVAFLEAAEGAEGKLPGFAGAEGERRDLGRSDAV